jgi:putative heme-binding domain-containing protein
MLAYADNADAAPTLLDLLKTNRAASVQLAALAALDQFTNPEVASAVLNAWSNLVPRARAEAVSVMIKRPGRAIRLLDAIRSKQIEQSELDAQQINFLLNAKDEHVRSAASKVLTAPTTQRTNVVELFRPALALVGNAGNGRTLYQQRCISCHRAESEGFAVGPDLVTVKNSGSEKLMTSILDPNREVAANYIAYLVDTKDGESLLGILTSDTTTTITIRQAYGREVTLARSRIKRMISQGKSLMPEGLEVGLSPQQMADLLAFIASANASTSKPAPATAQ